MSAQKTYKEEIEEWKTQQEIKQWRREFLKSTGEKWQEVYKRYLVSKLWKDVKAPIIARSKGKCENCGSYSISVDIHHKNYDRIGGKEKPEDLIALCFECHKKADRKRDRVTSRRIEEEIEGNIYDAGLNTFGKKKYGENWEIDPGYEVVKDEFDEWLAKKELEDDEDYY